MVKRGGGGPTLVEDEGKGKEKLVPFSGVHRVIRTYVQIEKGEELRIQKTQTLITYIFTSIWVLTTQYAGQHLLFSSFCI